MNNSNYHLSTGVVSLDRLLGGGVQTGIHVVISGESGSGYTELVRTILTTIVSISNTNSDDKPAVIGYISATKPFYELQSELLELSPDISLENIKFLDLSPATFLGSVVPQRWVLDDEERLNEIASIGRGELIQELIVQFLETLPPNSVVFLDFVPQLSSLGNIVEWDDLILLLYGVRRLAHDQNHIVFTISDHIALGKKREEQVAMTAEGVINLEWEEITAYQRQRIMYIRNWPGLSFSQEDGSAMKFSISYSKKTGFEVSTVRQIMGR